jgi:ABC-type transport system involved in multi-copper enzyme maturation permease subunit
MRQFATIARNAFMELIRQPVFLLLMTASVAFILFLATPYYFAFGDEPKLVKNSTLAVMLLAGLFGAVVSASASLAREIRAGTALAVLAKPVGRAQFIFAKFVGVAAALALLAYVNLLGCLLASRMAFDAYGSTDLFALGVFAVALVLAYALGGFSNFFLRRPFVSDAVLGVILMATLAFVVINFFNQHGKPQEFAHGVDWNVVPAGILILFALWILAALAIACSTRLDMIPTLAICSALFLLGLMSDYLFGRAADKGHWWGTVLYSVVPNWQQFWVADALSTGRSTFHWGYVAKAAGYMACYVGAALAVATALFEDRELS